MRILYVTDLHGCTWKYEEVLKAAKNEHVAAVINGGDMLPKNVDLRHQDILIQEFLVEHLRDYEVAKIAYLYMPGNDDLKAFDPVLEAACAKHGALWMAGRRNLLQGHEVIGFNLVVDYPFLLKDRCRMDDHDHVFCRQLGKGMLSDRQDGLGRPYAGFLTLDDWIEHAKRLPTIKEELAKLPVPTDPSKAIYVIHMPPSGLNLDVCTRGEAVGSKAIRRFLEAAQPLLSLHGHIHESPQVSGAWQAPLGRTTCVQPGQMGRLCYAMIDIDGAEVKAIRREG